MKKFLKRKFIIIAIIVIVVLVGTNTLAKYIVEEYHAYYLNAKHFYFTSNRLKKDNPTYTINNWSGVGSFNISYNLLAQKNEYVFTDYDIAYTTSVTCPSGVTCTLSKTSGTIYNSGNHSDTVVLSVNPGRSYSEGERLIIDITASSTAPYVETIRSRFEYVVGKQGVTYEIDDEPNQVYFILKITNAINYCKVNTAFSNYAVGALIDNSVFRTLDPADQAKCISKYVDLSFDPNVVLIDTTDSLIDASTYTSTTINGVSYINTLNTHIDPLSTMAIKFYKKNVSLDYTYPITNQTSVIGVNFHD